MIWKISKKYILISLIIILFLVLSYCDSDGGTPISIDLNNKDKVAEVVIRLIEVSKNNDLTKEKKKSTIQSILYEYGIDTQSETIKFAKKVQKYSYNKVFKDNLLKLYE
jgi:hypothetical protein